jgi:hypothetical protein
VSEVIVAPTAWEALDDLIRTRSLPSSAHGRVVASIEALRVYPDRGRSLTGRWAGLRCVLGPWPWMLIVYGVDQASDAVYVVTIQDARTAASATGPE